MRIRYLLLSAALAALPALESQACRLTTALKQEDRERADLIVFGTPVSYQGDVLELAVEETFKGAVSTKTIRIRMTSNIGWSPPKNLPDLVRMYGRRVGVGAANSETTALPELIAPQCKAGYIFNSKGAFELFGYGTPESVERDRIESWGETLNEAGFRSVDEVEDVLAKVRRLAVRRDQAALDAKMPFHFVPDEDQWKALETLGLKDLRLWHVEPPRVVVSRSEFGILWITRVDGDFVLTRL
ncbi:MAG: hypothetical protein RLO80_07295 [Hyphomonas sp.]